MINKVSIHFNKNGLTLVEVLASIILISIVLFTFFSFFIQSAKTGKSSEEVVDATYLAQGEMEKLYEISRKADFEDVTNRLVNGLDYTQDEEFVFKKTIEGLYIQLKFKKHFYPNMTYLVIEVFEQDDGTRPRAKMETILEWGHKS